MTAQAFYQARYRINALVFGELNQELIRLVEKHLPIPRWRGLRLVAADGSAVRLTLMKDGVRSIVQGVAFGLYLPGIELFLDFRLFEPLCDERQMLFEAIDNLRADDVLLLDRGFPCRWLVSALTARGIPFCIRCDLSRGFKAFREFMVTSQKPWAGAWHWVGFGATHSPAEYPSEVPVERIDPDGLDRQQGLVVNIELAAAGGLSEAEPVGSLVGGAAKA